MRRAFKAANDKQLELFAAPTPTTLDDKIEECTSCGAEIVLRRYTSDGVISEYRNSDGECFRYTFPSTTCPQ